jgi:hypothetical protein
MVQNPALRSSVGDTTKVNGLSSFKYLMHILKALPTLNIDADLEYILSWNATLAQH